MFTLTTPLQNIIFYKYDQPLLNRILFLLLGVSLLAISSQLSIPLPVPLTFQSATVILIGMAYGSRRGGEVILAYYVAGLCGVPVFANWNFGPHVFFGPTGGYLLGFLPAACLSGYLAERGWGRSVISSFIAACLGAGIIFTVGLIQLAYFVNGRQAIELGLLPFILSEPIKLIAVALVIPKLWRNPQHGNSI